MVTGFGLVARAPVRDPDSASRRVPSRNPRCDTFSLAMTRRFTVWSLCTLLVLLAACTRSADKQPNILLIVVDTLRADHLTSYGYGRNTSPAIDALAARGARFDRNRGQAPCTFPSMNSMLTSRPVETFFGQPLGDMGIPARVTSVAEVLASAGYFTAAFSASPIVRKNPTEFNTVGGFDRGFQLFDDECLWEDARCVNNRSMAALERHRTSDPVFFYLHYIDPHGPYQSPGKGRDRRFARKSYRDDLQPDVRAGHSSAASERIDRGEPSGLDAADLAHFINLYDDEIIWVDKRIGEVIAAFEAIAPPRGTIVVLASDHGEAFLEHGTLTHCHALFDNEIRTPLIVAGPGIRSGEVYDTLSENLDIVPTLLDLVGSQAEPGKFSGRSLRPTLTQSNGRAAETGPERLQTSAFNGWRSAFDGRHKLMVNETEQKVWLFDLSQNPGETIDLAETEQRTAAALRRALAIQSPIADEALEAARETERQLHALGYL